MERASIPSRRVWSAAGYSRAVRVGGVIEVSGTTASGPDGAIHFPGDMYGQAHFACELILKAVRSLGGQDEDVARTRVFMTDISRWQEVGRAHFEAFGRNPPASAFYEVQALLHPDLLVEIEATAYLGGDPTAVRAPE